MSEGRVPHCNARLYEYDEFLTERYVRSRTRHVSEICVCTIQ